MILEHGSRIVYEKKMFPKKSRLYPKVLTILATVDDDYDVSWLREDFPATTVDVPEYMLDMRAEPEIDDSDDEIEDETLWDFMQASEDED
uniref:Uncharacterized protein n=1 Tax=Chenopodium quinoa TaxID=63459 RepID=A0A803LSU6_CHEQI